ncbi:MAG: G5 domain-containing protein [Candidatus Saccharibacteria bacterium]|nr:G5 domain-containing protein [Candidatus Saccharibacteria bacterium]
MKLSRRIDQALAFVILITLALVFGCLMKVWSTNTYAEGDTETFTAVEAKFVTFYDDGSKLTVKTDAVKVADALERADIMINPGDIVEPGLDTEINAENFFINIYRARPVVIKDGAVDKHLMTASYDYKTIADEAGITIYDGDEMAMIPNDNFLENGAASVYQITRNGGRTLTVEEEIPFGEETVKDPGLEKGKTEVRQLGEVGTKKVYYNVMYVNNEEVSREKVNEEIVRQPVTRITAVGAKASVRPEQATCAEWVRAAGVSEADVAAAVDLIYHESGCRVDAANAYSGAYGIPQALPGSKMASAGADWETNPVTQIRWMAGYVSRYGGWQGALNFWYAHGWY